MFGGRKVGIDIIGKQQKETPIFSGANPHGETKIKGVSDYFEDFDFFQADLNIGK